ncbi:MAG TPA: nitronate monooxygenase [Phenylobacterium sp.]|uniref:NAD(P)H-dependent flavin oxidoreductase n=1 Tax=Phenylobacterium sp. TaxID=1871053 RepID=UPI002C8066A1|nr:nitronate monooxygenase [Phenylobacterium sp.]HSV02024.1 nitronate monooxygenase [Phenylobacterium sp.]
MKTALCSLLGIELPIVQAPMGGATTPELAAAVSNAGGLGTLALSWHPPEAVRAVIRATRALTERPFAVNLVLAFPQEQRLKVCLEEGVPVISFFWGDPELHLPAVRAAGAKSLLTVASAAQARRAADAGVDAVVAQGWEAGGHVLGEVATLPLVRAVVDEVAPMPVVAAGGISDGRGLLAALALGAAGVWIGTRFLTAPEAAIHPEYRRRLIEAAETATVHTRLFDGGWPDAPHRVLRNSTYEAWEAAGRPAPGARPGEGEPVAKGGFGEAPRYAATTPGRETSGDIEALSLWSGQGVAQLRREQPAAEIVREIAGEARAVLTSLQRELQL